MGGLYAVLLALALVGCAGPSLVTPEQARGIRDRERALAAHGTAIQLAIREAGAEGALAFLDTSTGRLVALPGDSPADAWARRAAKPDAAAPSPPPVLTFVHRADIPIAPEPVTLAAVQRQQALRTSLAALESDFQETHRRLEERVAAVQRELTESVQTSKRDSDTALAATRAELQKALTGVADDLASTRRFMLQTAQLAWLNHETNVENANAVRKVASASQELSSSSAKLEDTIRQLSQTLSAQLRELSNRLDALQGKVSSLK
ncbi:MAG TPA: hypothetical protein VJU81_24890 [Methylomirabilota bacterium]|nr:hypothetical protein [Methylomirabilota bacterium]